MDGNLNFEGDPVTTDIPMLYDETNYKIYIILKKCKYNNTEIKAVSKVCNINYIQARNKLSVKKNLIAQGRAYHVRDIVLVLLQYHVDFEIDPPYPYEINI